MFMISIMIAVLIYSQKKIFQKNHIPSTFTMWVILVLFVLRFAIVILIKIMYNVEQILLWEKGGQNRMLIRKLFRRACVPLLLALLVFELLQNFC